MSRKTLILINNEKKNYKIKAVKATNIYACANMDLAACVENGADVCQLDDYAACITEAVDVCSVSDQSSCEEKHYDSCRIDISYCEEAVKYDFESQ